MVDTYRIELKQSVYGGWTWAIYLGSERINWTTYSVNFPNAIRDAYDAMMELETQEEG